jgi:hypothetical protein
MASAFWQQSEQDYSVDSFKAKGLGQYHRLICKRITEVIQYCDTLTFGALSPPNT